MKLDESISNIEHVKCSAGMGVNDSFVGRGSVRKRIIEKATGRVVYEEENHNLIVKVGREKLIRLISGLSNDYIKSMYVGYGGTADLTTNAFNPIAPNDSDIALSNRISNVSSTVTCTTDFTTSTPSATYTALFDCEDVNNYVNECALMFSDNSMFARHTFKTVSLESTSGFNMEISWKIQFAGGES